MNTITVKQSARIPEHLKEQAKFVSILSLAEHLTELHRESTTERSGPCPKPNCDARTNGFHCTDEWFFCRKCHPKRGDAIEFIRWLYGYDFPQAVQQLTNGSILTTKQQIICRSTQRLAARPEEWRRRAEPILRQAQERLWGPVGTPAQEYLLDRGLEPHTWQQFGIGYWPDAPLPGTKGRKRAPAIFIPWLPGGKLRAVRYRFLQMQHYTDDDGRERNEKQAAEFGS